MVVVPTMVMPFLEVSADVSNKGDLSKTGFMGDGDFGAVGFGVGELGGVGVADGDPSQAVIVRVVVAEVRVGKRAKAVAAKQAAGFKVFY